MKGWLARGLASLGWVSGKLQGRSGVESGWAVTSSSAAQPENQRSTGECCTAAIDWKGRRDADVDAWRRAEGEAGGGFWNGCERRRRLSQNHRGFLSRMGTPDFTVARGPRFPRVAPPGLPHSPRPDPEVLRFPLIAPAKAPGMASLHHHHPRAATVL